MQDKKRVLFVAESATLCHVTRPLCLAEGLKEAEIHFACQSRFAKLVPETYQFHSLDSMPSEAFLANLQQGRPAFSLETLRKYCVADLELIDRVRPDLVVGDLRLSLSVSARARNVPYWSIVNAYWSPFAKQRWVVPDIPLTKWMPTAIANSLFNFVRPMAFALHCRPLNALRKEYGQKSLGSNLCEVYSDADHTLYADSADLVPTQELPNNHHYLGPILWSTQGNIDPNWLSTNQTRPKVFISLGSSGPAHLLSKLVLGLTERLPDVAFIVATSGRSTLAEHASGRDNLLVADYFPADLACKIANLLVCHGGSASAYVALANGTPVLGIPSLLDQHLTLQYIVEKSAGDFVRAEACTSASLAQKVREMLTSDKYKNGAMQVATDFATYDPPTTFSQLVEKHICLNTAEKGELVCA